MSRVVSTEQITDEFMGEMMTRSRPYTAMLLRQGPNWDRPDRQQIIWEHGRRNFALRADGVLAIVCPILDGGVWCGIGLFAAGEDEVAEMMDGDPGVTAGVFEYEVHPVRSFPGDCLPPSPEAP
jgi:hypothetical protein